MAIVSSGLPAVNTAVIAQIKTMLGITDSTLDQLLTICYNGADTGVRSYLRRGAARTVFAAWPELCTDSIYMSGDDRPELIFPYIPLVNVQALYLDPNGYAGQGQNNPFNSSTLLTPGRDYMVDIDDGQQSAKGIIRRLGGLNSGGIWGNYGWAPNSGTGSWQGSGPLALGGRNLASWPAFPGCIKITATVGYAAPLPYDLQAATMELAIFLYNTRKTGGLMYSSESLSAYSYAYLTNSKLPEIGTMRQQLARYRSDIPF